MFVLGDPHDETKDCFALRPMTCPFQYQVYLNRQRSYRDLPMRLTETSTLFRNEDSGEMHGLIRVRQFTISEGHYILRPDQLEEEFKNCLQLAKYFLDTVGLLDDCTFRFSQWDPANPGNKYEGTSEQWEEAQRVMGNILDHLGVKYEVGIDGRRSMARSWTSSTRMYSARKIPWLPSRSICCWQSGLVCTTRTRTVRKSCRTSSTEHPWAAMSVRWHT